MLYTVIIHAVAKCQEAPQPNADVNIDVVGTFSQATAEQIRLAQMISDHNDADFEEKVKQVSKRTRSTYPTPLKVEQCSIDCIISTE